MLKAQESLKLIWVFIRKCAFPAFSYTSFLSKNKMYGQKNMCCNSIDSAPSNTEFSAALCETNPKNQSRCVCLMVAGEVLIFQKQKGIRRF